MNYIECKEKLNLIKYVITMMMTEHYIYKNMT